MKQFLVEKYRSLGGVLAAVLLLALVGWPTEARANSVVEWNRLMLKFEPGPRLMLGLRLATLMHVSMHDAINSIPDSRRFGTYSPAVAAAAGASPEAASNAAAHWILRQYVQTYDPANTQRLAEIEALYANSQAFIPEGPEKAEGIRVGEAAASAFWQARLHDGWNNPNGTQYTYAPPAPGVFRMFAPFPPTLVVPFHWWDDVTPFTMTDKAQFMAPPPLELTDKRYLEDLAEVQAYGSLNSTVRTADQSASARWWGGCTDNVAVIGGDLARLHGRDLHDTARIFALFALVQADVMISNVHNKKHWNFWRPITAIRESGQTDWTPYLLTPPSWEYPAGHGMGSGAGVYLLAKFFPENFKRPITFVSPVCGPRTFERLSDVVDDVVGARVWGGMHFRRSGEEGAALGKKVAHWVFERYLLPLNQ